MQAALIFGTALAVRLLHIWAIRRSPFFDVLMGDSKAYDAWAQRIAGGDWIGTGVFYQAPLYPYFLGILYSTFGRDLLMVRVVQAVLGASACVLLALAARRLVPRAGSRVGLVAGLGLALYAPAIFFDGLIQKAAPELFLMCLALWLVSRSIDDEGRRGNWLALGAVMGALSLSRENALVLVVVIACWTLVHGAGTWRARGTAATLFAAGLAIVLLPVAVRNHAVGGGFYLTTSQFGTNFYLGNNAVTDGTAGSLRSGRGAAEYERSDAIELAEAAEGRTLTPAEVSEFWTARALDFITSEPARWLRLMARKFALLWNATEMLDTEAQESYADWSWPLRYLGVIGHFGVLVPLAVVGIVATWPDRRRLWVLYAMGAAYAASVVLFFIYARYRYPLVPLLMLFGAVGAVRLSSAGTEAPAGANVRRAKAAGPARADADPRPRLSMSSGRRRYILIAAVAALFTNWPALSKDRMRAITEHNLGAELQSAGRIDDAIAHYRRAIALTPDYAPAYNNLGTALLAQGRASEAVQNYEHALALAPDYANAHYNLGNALLNDGRSAESIPHFRRSLELGPGSADVHNNLGIALAEQNDIDGAIGQFQRALRFEPDSREAHRNLASLYLSRRQLPEAIGELRAVASAAPDNAEAQNDLGLALAAAGNLEEAAAQFERALALEPGFSEARRNLAGVRAQEAKAQTAR